jgi:hypothetical protein
VVAVALPFSGFTLYWDAGSWPSGLIAFAHTPWVWWAFRRTLRGRLNPCWAVLVGALAVLQGNPYGTLGVVVVGVGMLLEAMVTRNTAGLLRVLGVGVLVAAFLPLVYLPLLESSQLASRSGGDLFHNTGKLRPGLGDILTSSAPTFVPSIKAITGPMLVPATYFAWFVVPLLPWLRYGVLRDRARQLTGLGVIAGLYLALAMGPTKLWLFRWPLRLVEYFYLGVGVLFAVLLSQGLARDHWRRRAGLSALLVLAGAWLSWAQEPLWRGAALGGTIMVVLLVGVTLAWHRWGPAAPALLALGLIAGTGLVQAGQSQVFPENHSSRLWHVPGDVELLQKRFAHLDGRVIQFADVRNLQRPREDRRLRAAWRHVLPGSLYDVTGVDAVNAYTGMGFKPFERRLCFHYEGFAKPCGYPHLWQPVATGEPLLADLMKVDTVVVQPKLARDVLPPAGWSVERDPHLITLRRTSALPWPGSRLSFVTPGVTVSGAESAGRYQEQARLSTGDQPGRAVFAMLSWPGYTATLAGRPVQVGQDDAGLLTVELPAGSTGELVVTYRPPGLTVGLVVAAVGGLGALGWGLVAATRRRRGR